MRPWSDGRDQRFDKVPAAVVAQAEAFNKTMAEPGTTWRDQRAWKQAPVFLVGNDGLAGQTKPPQA